MLAACSTPTIDPAPTPVPLTLADASAPEAVDLYRAAGFVVGSGSIPFVGLVRFAATEYVDSTSVIVALSIPPRSLSFVRAGDRYAAFYAVRLDLMQGDAIVRSERPAGEVRVANFAETTRGDEGVIFQRTMRVAPGVYSLRLTASDSLGTGTGAATSHLAVPVLRDGTIAPMIPVFSAEPRRARSTALGIITNPRATVRYGRDSVLTLYFEAYGDAIPDTVLVSAYRDGYSAAPLVVDTVVVPPNSPVRAVRSALPVANLGLGAIRVSASGASREFGSLTAVVNLGFDIPVTSVDELIDALRYFASEPELQRFRSASVVARPGQWATLVRRTDPNPATPDNEALLEYARRLRVAERLFRGGDVRGWRGDRGSVLAALGEPDVMTTSQPDSLGATRVLTWEYRRHRMLLHFAEAAGSGVWRLTPLSDVDFRDLLAVAGPCVGCR